MSREQLRVSVRTMLSQLPLPHVGVMQVRLSSPVSSQSPRESAAGAPAGAARAAAGVAIRIDRAGAGLGARVRTAAPPTALPGRHAPALRAVLRAATRRRAGAPRTLGPHAAGVAVRVPRAALHLGARIGGAAPPGADPRRHRAASRPRLAARPREAAARAPPPFHGVSTGEPLSGPSAGIGLHGGAAGAAAAGAAEARDGALPAPGAVAEPVVVAARPRSDHVSGTIGVAGAPDAAPGPLRTGRRSHAGIAGVDRAAPAAAGVAPVAEDSIVAGRRVRDVLAAAGSAAVVGTWVSVVAHRRDACAPAAGLRRTAERRSHARVALAAGRLAGARHAGARAAPRVLAAEGGIAPAVGGGGAFPVVRPDEASATFAAGHGAGDGVVRAVGVGDAGGPRSAVGRCVGSGPVDESRISGAGSVPRPPVRARQPAPTHGAIQSGGAGCTAPRGRDPYGGTQGGRSRAGGGRPPEYRTQGKSAAPSCTAPRGRDPYGGTQGGSVPRRRGPTPRVPDVGEERGAQLHSAATRADAPDAPPLFTPTASSIDPPRPRCEAAPLSCNRE